MTHVLIIGFGPGSWTMRGEQLGAALGARVAAVPLARDLAWADVVVLVKRAGPLFAATVHRAGRPLVWDALDFWAQPGANASSETTARALLRAQLTAVRPTLTIGATRAMTDAIRAAGCAAAYLPHHCRIGLTPAPVGAHVHTVAYDGNALYLGRWARWLTQACSRRGWQFLINPPDLRVADLVVAFRDGPWDGWMCRHWKSGVKAINAIAAGRPLLRQPCAGSSELAAPGSDLEEPQHLDDVFDAWASHDARLSAVQPRRAVSVEAVAAQYRDLLATVGAHVWA